jgi:hypothetical protein
MYLHNQDWPAAMRVAERCEPGAVDDIYLAQVCDPPQLCLVLCSALLGPWGTTGKCAHNRAQAVA